MYYWSWKAPAVLSAFHSVVNRPMTGELDKRYDPNAAGPLACFTYLQSVGIQAISVNLVHTSPDIEKRGLPGSWLQSTFQGIGRIWSTCKVRTLSSATDELSALNPNQRRQEFATTTIKNDLPTLQAAHTAYRDAIKTIRKHKIKGMSWTLVLQPLLPTWTRKGDGNPMGLNDGDEDPLVVVSFTVNWALGKDDEVVQRITEEAIKQIEACAREKGTDHRFLYLNYCAKWQKPFEGYGERNLEFLKGVSRDVDPEGLFQKGCRGGFKLGV